MTTEQKAHLALRIGVAFAFLYPPFAALSDPYSWIGYFPSFLHALPVSELVLLHAFGVLEVAIALWILSGRNIRIPAAIATFLLVGIVLFNLPEFPVLFRDLAIACMTVALVLWPRTERTA